MSGLLVYTLNYTHTHKTKFRIFHFVDVFCSYADCSEKFVSEADYNVHINTHMNYGHKCGVAGCGHTFLTRKRLELHCRVMHGLELHGKKITRSYAVIHTVMPVSQHPIS